jgi:hypothetical protein
MVLRTLIAALQSPDCSIYRQCKTRAEKARERLLPKSCG